MNENKIETVTEMLEARRAINRAGGSIPDIGQEIEYVKKDDISW